jgi:PAS domain S-box-containing protein
VEHSRLFGFDPERGLPSRDGLLQRIHPEDLDRVVETYESAVRERTEVEVDFRTVLPNGTMKYIHSVGHPVFNEAGDLVEFMGTVMDVTERSQSLSEAPRSMHALRPEGLREGNFWDALKEIIKGNIVGTTLHPSFKVQGKPDQLPPVWQENLLQIGQEALANTIKYAHARKFGTRLVYNLKGLRLEFSDDGDGFEPEGHDDGSGLAGMRERVEQMGGELKIASARGKGTKITVVLPRNGESDVMTSNKNLATPG